GRWKDAFTAIDLALTLDSELAANWPRGRVAVPAALLIAAGIVLTALAWRYLRWKVRSNALPNQTRLVSPDHPTLEAGWFVTEARKVENCIRSASRSWATRLSRPREGKKLG